MAKKCPNRSHPDFKSLIDKYGESVAYLLYDLNGYEIPEPTEVNKLIKIANTIDPNINSILNSEDPRMTDFVLETLKKNYPDVKIFNSKGEFKAYVERYKRHLNDGNIKALGNAFRDAIFVDPSGPVQEIHIHEHSHLYWNALGTDNKIKNKIIDFLRQEGIYESDIEEEAVRMITVSGMDIAEIKFKGTVLEKFLELLKEFWAEVKNVFGAENLTDLNYLLAKEVWNNKKKFNQASFTNNYIMNMTVNPYNIFYDDSDHSYHHGDNTFYSVTRSLSLISTFNPDLAANIAWNSHIATMKKAKTPISEHISEKNKFIQTLKDRWIRQAEIGTATHSISQAIIEGKSFENIKNIVVNKEKGTKISDYFEPDILVKTHDVIKNFIDKQKKAGWQIRSEVLLGSLEHRMAGTADVVLEKDGDVRILDFKTHFKEDKSDKFYGKTFKNILTNVSDTKENRYRLQTNIYANMYEMQEDVDVRQTIILPFVYDMNEENMVSVFEEKKVVEHNRSKRGSLKKDKNREEAYELMNYTKKHLELQAKLKEKRNISQDLKKNEETPLKLIKEEADYITLIESVTGKSLEDITGDDLSFITQDGFLYLSEYLLNNLGYSKDHLFGKNAMPIDDFVNIVLGIRGGSAGINVEDYVPRSEKTEQKELEQFSEGDPIQLLKLNKILNEWDTMAHFASLSTNDLIKMYSQIQAFQISKASNIKAFLSSEIFNRMAAEKLVDYAKNPSPYINHMVLLLGRMLKSDNALFNDFDSLNVIDSKWLRNPMLVNNKNILLQSFMKDMMASHVTIVEKTVVTRAKMQALVKDTMLDNVKIDWKDRKPLSHQDFESIMYKDKFGMKRMMLPSEAREELEKKYGKDKSKDSRPYRMANYLSLYYNILSQNDPRIKEEFEYAYSLRDSWGNTDRKYFGPILSPIREMDIFEFKSKFKDTIKFYNPYKIIHAYNLLKKGAYDYVEINGVPLYDIKQEIYSDMIDANDRGDTKTFDRLLKHLETQNENASNLYIRSSKQSKKIKVKNLQSSKITLVSANSNAAIQEHMASFLEAKHMEKMLPIANFTKNLYSEIIKKRGTSGSRVAADAIDFIDQIVDAKIFHDIDDFMYHSLAREKTATIIEFITGWMTKTYLAFSIAGNVNNRITGINQNWMWHPSIMAMSNKRMVKYLTEYAVQGLGGKKADKYSNIGYRKLANIMKNYNISSITQDANFAQIQEYFDKLDQFAFLPLEYAEMKNQGTLLRGIMTDAEIRAYNTQGHPLMVYKDEILDPDMDLSKMDAFKKDQFKFKLSRAKQHPDAFSMDRVLHIKSAIAEVHGFYGWSKTTNSYYILGRSIGQLWFGWFQAGLRKLYSERTTDTMNIEHIGLINALYGELQNGLFNMTYGSKMSKAKVRKALNKVYGEGFTKKEDAEKYILSYDKYADTDEMIEEVEVFGNKVFYVKKYNTDLSDFQELLLEGRNASDLIGELENMHTVNINKKDKIYTNAMISMVMLIAIKALWETMGLALKHLDDDIMYGEPDEFNKRRGSKKGMNELSNLEFRKHKFYQFLLKRTYMANNDIVPLFSFDFWNNKLKTPIPLLSFGERSVKLFSQLGEKNMTPTDKARIFEPKTINNLLMLLPYLNSPIMLGREMNRAYHSSMKKEYIQLEANRYASDVISKILSAEIMVKEGRFNKEKGNAGLSGLSEEDIIEYLDDAKNLKKELRDNLINAYLHKYYGIALKAQIKGRNRNFTVWKIYEETVRNTIIEHEEEGYKFNKSLHKEIGKTTEKIDKDVAENILKQSKNN